MADIIISKSSIGNLKITKNLTLQIVQHRLIGLQLNMINNELYALATAGSRQEKLLIIINLY